MQIHSLRIKSYRSWKVNETPISEIAKERLEKIQIFNKLKKEKCSTNVALQAIQVKRSTFFVWKKRYKEDGLKGLNPKSRKPKNIRKPTWTKSLENQVSKLRKKYPYWGKEKIHRLLIRDYGYKKISISTIGRIIKKLIQLKRILPVNLVTGKKKPKKKRNFDKHAKRWKYGMKSKKPGELIQLDHMTVYSNSRNVKHFKSVCPTSKIMITDVYSSASSKNAKKFLEKMIKELPFPILSLQVDGGSEFMKDFEAACKELKIPLFVLPPRSPKYNGNVERANGVAREEFYSQYGGVFDISNIRVHLQEYQNMYNDFRPHQALDYLTPNEYTELLLKEAI